MVHGRMHLRGACRHQEKGRLGRAGVRAPRVGEWLAAKKGLRAGTVRSYESHIRLYLAPCVGHIPLDRLRVADVASVFDYVGGLNEAVTAARASGDPGLRNAVKGRRLVGLASCQRIRATQGAPKSDAGDRIVALDAVTVADIRRHRREQDTERETAGDAWAGSGFEFTDEHGGPLHPADVTYAFHMIAYLAGLPPVRLHDLRHGAATLL
jgi:hypothetical protein